MTKPDLAESFSNLAKSIIESKRQSHAGLVMNVVAILDYDLERSIKTKMPSLDKKLAKELFETYRPLRTFAAKIDVAFALDIITAEIHTELHKIRKIRNRFSHSKSGLSLDVEPIQSLFYQLKRPAGITGTYLQQFVECAVIIDKYLEAFLLRMGITEDLSILPKTQFDEEATPGPP